MANPSSTGHREEGMQGSSGGQQGRGGNRPGGGGSSSSVTDKASEMASGAMDKARDVASTVADKARDMASSVGSSASGMASSLGQHAQDATSAVAGGMKSLAGTIRESAPHSGAMGSASSALADTLEHGGRYLQEEGLKGIGDDLTHLIRRNPIPAMLLGVGIGYLLARSTSRS